MDQVWQSTSNQNSKARFREKPHEANSGYAHTMAHYGFAQFFLQLTSVHMQAVLVATQVCTTQVSQECPYQKLEHKPNHPLQYLMPLKIQVML